MDVSLESSLSIEDLLESIFITRDIKSSAISVLSIQPELSVTRIWLTFRQNHVYLSGKDVSSHSQLVSGQISEQRFWGIGSEDAF